MNMGQNYSNLIKCIVFLCLSILISFFGVYMVSYLKSVLYFFSSNRYEYEKEQAEKLYSQNIVRKNLEKIK
jgi:hypothetical protein